MVNNGLCYDMNFQPSKCENRRVSRKRISPVRSYSLDDTSLKVVKVKDLGVMVTKDLTWSNHVRCVTAKANRMLGFITRNCAGIINKDALSCCTFPWYVLTFVIVVKYGLLKHQC